ncbi:MAG: peptidoglycan-associated lipoprotein Pal [Gammaproteobacteria bacterium]|jgi:peptidoglycan-associated lipoprotein
MSIFNRNHLIALIAAASIAGCSSTPEDTTGGSTAGTDTTSYESTATDTSAQVDPALQGRVVYFDFDKYDIRYDAEAILSAHAAYLSANPGARVRVEGHADERGTREYNMALGERRAKAAAAYLASKGASSSQIEVISYGEERPSALGHEESSWSQNRRAELQYTSEAP